MKVASKEQQSQSAINPWQINEDDFPQEGTTVAKLEFLLKYAILAPSTHNTQPWRFRLVDDLVELYADKTRALPVVDPDHRELVISCGAALFHLRIAMRHFGYQDLVEILPESTDSQLLARIALGSRRIVKVEENFLFRAILKRYTNRRPFKQDRPSAALISELESATCAHGDWLQIITRKIPAASREAIINLIAHGDRLQMADPLFREELAQWIHTSNSSNHDRLTAQSQGFNDRFDPIVPLISFAIRAFDFGHLQAEYDRELSKNAPVLIMISSRGDTLQDWLATGEALAHLLLRARVDDVWASFFNQPIEIPQLRSRLQNLLPENGYPQILLRLGYGQVKNNDNDDHFPKKAG